MPPEVFDLFNLFGLTRSASYCSVCYIMTSKQPIHDTLRRAINESGLSFQALEKATGVIRQSLMPFARGEASISLPAVEKLAEYFGFELTPSNTEAEG